MLLQDPDSEFIQRLIDTDDVDIVILDFQDARALSKANGAYYLAATDNEPQLLLRPTLNRLAARGPRSASPTFQLRSSHTGEAVQPRAQPLILRPLLGPTFGSSSPIIVQQRRIVSPSFIPPLLRGTTRAVVPPAVLVPSSSDDDSYSYSYSSSSTSLSSSSCSSSNKRRNMSRDTPTLRVNSKRLAVNTVPWTPEPSPPLLVRSSVIDANAFRQMLVSCAPPRPATTPTMRLTPKSSSSLFIPPLLDPVATTTATITVPVSTTVDTRIMEDKSKFVPIATTNGGTCSIGPRSVHVVSQRKEEKVTFNRCFC